MPKKTRNDMSEFQEFFMYVFMVHLEIFGCGLLPIV